MSMIDPYHTIIDPYYTANGLCVGEYSDLEMKAQLYYRSGIDKFTKGHNSKAIKIHLDGYNIHINKKRIIVLLENNVCSYCGLQGNIWQLILPQLHGKDSGDKIHPYISLIHREKNGNKNIDTLMTIDHINPISKGGTSAYDNLVTACSPCNSSKGDGHTPAKMLQVRNKCIAKASKEGRIRSKNRNYLNGILVSVIIPDDIYQKILKEDLN